MNLEAEERRITKLASRLENLEHTVQRERDELGKAEWDLRHAQDAQEILQLLAQAVQQKAHERISEVVSSCLSAVFDDPYQFKIEFDRKRGQTEARLRFIRGDMEVDPMTASGGGMIDVASFALRIACIMMHRPKLSRVVVLDEPFKFVSAQYRENVRTMLEGLSKDLGIQIIMVTHIEELETGKVIEL